jgi:hypothetical protein
MSAFSKVLVKDESQRFGLKAFKMPGGSYAINTEGDTDRRGYREVVWEGRYPCA